ncbi:hypothetical protein KKG83_00630 [Candidatus Micrarchaeota archaeon]|nr:hypothetical protein [Candidatus Micrarchaeota archaeon]
MKKQLIAVIFLLTLISSANALIMPYKNEITISPSEAFSLPVRILNESDSKELIHLRVLTDLEAEFAENDFYLNAGEETTIALNLMPYHFFGSHTVNLIAEYPEQGFSQNAWLTVNISQGNELELRYYRQNICNNTLDSLNLWVKNNSLGGKRINLTASSEVFNPSLDKDYLELQSGEEKLVKVELYSDKTFPLDDYSVVVFAETDSTIISKELFFDLVECIQPKKPFILTLNANEFSLKKEETRKIYFTVRNLDEESNEIQFAVKSDLKTKLQQNISVLDGEETRTFWLEVEALKGNDTGKHKVELYAFNQFNDTKKVFYVDVIGLHEVTSTLLTSHPEIQRGQSKIFTLLVENKGDFRERIELREYSDEEINVNLSEENFYLNTKESKKVYLSVNPLLDSELGNKKIRVNIKGKDIYLKFKVVKEEKPLIEEGMIELLSVPEKVTLTEKEAKITVVIKNISGEKIENVVFWIEGLPEGVYFNSVLSKNIEINNSRELMGKLLLDQENAVKGTYTIKLVFENSGFRQEKEIQLVVLEEETQEEKQEKEKQENPGFIAGLFSLATSQFIGLLVIALVILILLFSPGNRKERWQKKKEIQGE